MLPLWLCYKLLDIPHWTTNDLKAHQSFKYSEDRSLLLKTLIFILNPSLNFSLNPVLVQISICSHSNGDKDAFCISMTDSHLQMAFNNRQKVLDACKICLVKDLD